MWPAAAVRACETLPRQLLSGSGRRARRDAGRDADPLVPSARMLAHSPWKPWAAFATSLPLSASAFFQVSLCAIQGAFPDRAWRIRASQAQRLVLSWRLCPRERNGRLSMTSSRRRGQAPAGGVLNLRLTVRRQLWGASPRNERAHCLSCAPRSQVKVRRWFPLILGQRNHRLICQTYNSRILLGADMGGDNDNIR
jgi:hypothetical protein